MCEKIIQPDAERFSRGLRYVHEEDWSGDCSFHNKQRCTYRWTLKKSMPTE